MNQESNSLLLQIAIALSIVVTIVLNGLIEAIPVNGATSGQISDFYPSLFTPPGYVFAIWSVIYTLLIVTVLFQVRSS
ncbi:MAG: tryptophan-rich sensory protein, partial [Candidatus Thorarchaeota archaeon]